MKRTHEQLLSLLRTALWSWPVDTTLFAEGVDWRVLLLAAEKQTIVGVVYDAILTLPPALQPPTDLLRKMHLQTVRIAQSHSLLNRALAEVVALLDQHNIKSVLLKGQGVARNYPDPTRRTCGDIDLYVGADNYERACTLFYEKGVLDKHTTESIQHLHFNYKGVCIELHRIAGVIYSPSRNRQFRQWSDCLLQGDQCRTMELQGVQVSLPPIRFDAFYIFYHTFKHLLTGGVGLRQFCDWALYLHALSQDIERDLLLKELKRFHLLHPWQVMGCIVVHFLGLPQEEFPHFDSDPKVKKRAQAMMELIWEGGNFGFHNPKRLARPKGYLTGKLHTFVTMHRHFWHMLPLCPADTWGYYRSVLVEGLVRLYRDKFVTKTITRIK